MLMSIVQYKMTLAEQQSLKGNLRFGGEISLQVDYIILRSINDFGKEEKWDILIMLGYSYTKNLFEK